LKPCSVSTLQSGSITESMTMIVDEHHSLDDWRSSAAPKRADAALKIAFAVQLTVLAHGAVTDPPALHSVAICSP
jgi:hypothetical protein